MAKTTKRIAFTRTITVRYTADMANYATLSDAEALAAANLPGGINSIGDLLAQSPAAAGVYTQGAWSVHSAGVNIEPYGIFVPSFAFGIGERISPSTPNNRLHICRVAGTSASTEPTWATTIGASTTSGGAQFTCVDKFGAVLTFAISTAYTAGQIVKPTSGSASEFLVTVAGTSASSAPTWPTTVGSTVASGGATFLCIAI